jgi:hypothetical protein
MADGWVELGPRSIWHPCGIRVLRRKGNWWSVKTTNDALTTGFSSARQACTWAEANDPGFWEFEGPSSSGSYDGVILESGLSDAQRKFEAAVCSLDGVGAFPSHLRSAFKRTFLGVAKCAKCDANPAQIAIRLLPEYGNKSKRRVPYVVCRCGHPVWRMPYSFFGRVGLAFAQAIRSSRRRDALRNAGGACDEGEIREILVSQENRCIYCNVQFSVEMRPTRDHLLPVVYGGTDWSTNIVLACRRCNSRRGTIPFRTYCKLLSPNQNRRILRHLARRILGLDLESIPDEKFGAFLDGLRRHNPRDSAYQWNLRRYPKARLNAAANLLIPSRPLFILRLSDRLTSRAE